jgi:acyl-CoA thioester hydrolase
MRREDFNVWITVPVRWGDMDAFGHVNNAAYFTYCESARIRYFEEIGISAARPHGEGPAVVSASCNFHRQVRHPAILEVGARVTTIGNSSFTIAYGIYLEDLKDLVADGTSVAVWMDYVKERSKVLPEEHRRAIEELDSV